MHGEDAASGGHGLIQKNVGADDASGTDMGVASEDGGVGIDDHVVSDRRMTANMFDGMAVGVQGETLGTQGHSLVDFDAVADDTRFANDHASGVVDEKAATNACAGMEVDAGLGVGPFAHDAGDHGNLKSVEFMCEAVGGNREQAGIGELDLGVGERSGISIVCGCNVVDHVGTDVGKPVEEGLEDTLGLVVQIEVRRQGSLGDRRPSEPTEWQGSLDLGTEVSPGMAQATQQKNIKVVPGDGTRLHTSRKEEVNEHLQGGHHLRRIGVLREDILRDVLGGIPVQWREALDGVVEELAGAVGIVVRIHRGKLPWLRETVQRISTTSRIAAAREMGQSEPMTADPTHVRVILNPRSGLGVSVRALMETFSRQWEVDGRRVTYQISLSKGDGHLKARQAVEDGVGIVVAVGGDGLVNTIASELLGKEVALGVVPTGSGNGLARHFGIPLSPDDAVKALLHATARPVDVGLANGRPFVVTCSLAWEAALVKTFEKSPVRGILPYIFAAAYELFEYKPENFRMEVDGREAETIKEPMLFTIANLTQFGGGARIAPRARADDGRLWLAYALRADLPRLIPSLPKLFDGTIDQVPEIRVAPFRHLVVERETSQPIQLDGELVESPRRVEITVRPRALRLLVPEPYDNT